MMLALAAMVTGPAAAQDPMIGPSCMTGPAPIPPALAAWDMAMPLSAAHTATDLEQAQLTIGRRTDISLMPVAEVHFIVPPRGRNASGSHGGLASFTIERAGTYRIALGSDVAIGIVKGGQRVAPTGNAPGPACSSLRKTVDYAFTPGAYILQIAGDPRTSLPVLIIAL